MTIRMSDALDDNPHVGLLCPHPTNVECASSVIIAWLLLLPSKMILYSEICCCSTCVCHDRHDCLFQHQKCPLHTILFGRLQMPCGSRPRPATLPTSSSSPCCVLLILIALIDTLLSALLSSLITLAKSTLFH